MATGLVFFFFFCQGDTTEVESRFLDLLPARTQLQPTHICRISAYVSSDVLAPQETSETLENC